MSDQDRLYCKDPDGMYDAVAEYENGSFVVKAGSRIFRHVRTEDAIAQYSDAIGPGDILIKDIAFTFEKRATRFVTGGILKDNAWFTADGRSSEDVKDCVPVTSFAGAAPSAPSLATESSKNDDSITKLLNELADGLNDSWDLVTPASAAQPIVDRHTCIKKLEGIRNYLKGMRYLLHKNKAMAIAAFEEAAAFEHPDAMFMLAMINNDVEMLKKASALNYAPALVQLAIEHTEDGSEAQNLLYKAASAQYVSQNAPADADTSFIWDFLDDLDDDELVNQTYDEAEPLIRQMSLDDQNTDYDEIVLALKRLFARKENKQIRYSDAEIVAMSCGTMVISTAKLKLIFENLGKNTSSVNSILNQSGFFIQVCRGYWVAKDVAERLGYVDARKAAKIETIENKQTVSNSIK